MKKAEYLGIAFLVLMAGLVQAQDRPQGRHLVTITVAEERPHVLAHTIRIEADGFGPARSQEELDRRAWRAIRTSERGEETVGSEDCPALRQVVEAFAGLPPLGNAPPAMQVHAGPVQMAPTVKDGYVTRLTFSTIIADGSEAEVELRGGALYKKWANDAVGALNRCLGVLSFAPSGD